MSSKIRIRVARPVDNAPSFELKAPLHEDSLLRCHLCGFMLENPKARSCCGELFCADHAPLLTQCKQCMEIGEPIAAPRFIQKRLDDLEGTCTRCKKAMTRRKFRTHKEACKLARDKEQEESVASLRRKYKIAVEEAARHKSELENLKLAYRKEMSLLQEDLRIERSKVRILEAKAGHRQVPRLSRRIRVASNQPGAQNLSASPKHEEAMKRILEDCEAGFVPAVIYGDMDCADPALMRRFFIYGHCEQDQQQKEEEEEDEQRQKEGGEDANLQNAAAILRKLLNVNDDDADELFSGLRAYASFKKRGLPEHLHNPEFRHLHVRVETSMKQLERGVPINLDALFGYRSNHKDGEEEEEDEEEMPDLMPCQ